MKLCYSMGFDMFTHTHERAQIRADVRFTREKILETIADLAPRPITYKTIADKLDISEPTVKRHVPVLLSEGFIAGDVKRGRGGTRYRVTDAGREQLGTVNNGS